MTTITEIMTPAGVEIPAHLEAQAEVPVISGKPQRQGDVIVLPMRAGKVAGLKPVPSAGIPVVRGEAGGNTHLLVAAGTVSFAADDNDPQALGTLVVDKGASAYLIHAEHGAQGIGSGTYRIRRQREQADVTRTIAD
jgi:hypothetical protein